jgi:hypothetical protein
MFVGVVVIFPVHPVALSTIACPTAAGPPGTTPLSVIPAIEVHGVGGHAPAVAVKVAEIANVPNWLCALALQMDVNAVDDGAPPGLQVGFIYARQPPRPSATQPTSGM